MSYPKKCLIALPPAMMEQIDFIAQCEHRTRSDLIREALRRYSDAFKRSNMVQASPVHTREQELTVTSCV